MTEFYNYWWMKEKAEDGTESRPRRLTAKTLNGAKKQAQRLRLDSYYIYLGIGTASQWCKLIAVRLQEGHWHIL